MWPFIAFIVVAAGIIAVSAAGLSYAAPIKTSYKMFKCSIYLFANEALKYTACAKR